MYSLGLEHDTIYKECNVSDNIMNNFVKKNKYDSFKWSNCSLKRFDELRRYIKNIKRLKFIKLIILYF